MAFDKLTPRERITAVHVDIMTHSDFSVLGGITQVGKVIINDCPTAGTDGRDVYYGEKFIMGLRRKQLRYLCLHEQSHKALHHCTAYKEVCQKYPDLSNQAMDYCINIMLEDMDPDMKFLERPTNPAPLVDAAYRGLSWLEILRKLLDEQEKGKQQRQPSSGKGQPLDEHIPGQSEAEEAAGGEPGEGEGSLKQQIEDAIVQGKITSENLKRQRGEGAGGSALSGYQERRTDWRKPLRKFVQEVSEGDDQSRYAPPNKRMIPLDVILPSHFSEATGLLVVAVDTSGSMTSILPLVFGELCTICQSVQPTEVLVIWWDSKVQSTQRFTPKDYDKIKDLMQPRGGGGTTVSCVARYITEKKLKAKATIMLTDGYIESQYESPPGPLLWGIVNNTRFRPLRGKKVDIQEF